MITILELQKIVHDAVNVVEENGRDPGETYVFCLVTLSTTDLEIKVNDIDPDMVFIVSEELGFDGDKDNDANNR